MEGFEKRGYLLENFRLFHLNSSGMEAEFHYHDFCKLLLLRSGSGGYYIEGQRYSLRPGDVVLVDAGCVHRPEFPEGQPYERVIVYIDPDFLRRSSTPDCDLRALFAHTPVLRPGEDLRIASLAESLEAELAAGGFGSAIVSGGLLLQLLVEIGRVRETGTAESPAAMLPGDARFRALVEAIDRNPAGEFSVEALAGQVYLSKFHFMRKFKAETGQSVHEYITRRRLLWARDLIRQGENVTEVCFKVGFNSYSSFYRAYVKLFGVTPTGKREGNARENGEE